MIKYITIPDDIELSLGELRCKCGNALGDLYQAVSESVGAYLKEKYDITYDLSEAGKSKTTLAFPTFFINTILSDPQLIRKESAMEDSFLLKDLRDAIKDKRPEDVLELGLSDYERIMKVVKAPTNGYNPTLIVQIIPFLKALRDAADKKPEVPASEAASETA